MSTRPPLSERLLTRLLSLTTLSAATLPLVVYAGLLASLVGLISHETPLLAAGLLVVTVHLGLEAERLRRPDLAHRAAAAHFDRRARRPRPTAGLRLLHLIASHPRLTTSLLVLAGVLSVLGLAGPAPEAAATLLGISCALLPLYALLLVRRERIRLYLELRSAPPLALDTTTVRGWKLARIRADGASFWLEGVAGGSYRASADAECLTECSHLPPVISCSCGFHAWSTRPLAECYASELGLGYVLLEVEGFGDVLVYELGWRAGAQDVLGVHLPPCHCGAAPARLELVADRGAHTALPRCLGCSPEDAISLATLAGALGTEVHGRS